MYLIFNKQTGQLSGYADSLPNQRDLEGCGMVAVVVDEFDALAHYVFNAEGVQKAAAAPSKYHQLVEGKWVLSPEAKAQQLADAVAAKLAEINAAAEAFVNRAAELDKVPSFEVATWPLQATEAQAWAADPAAETPVLAQIAAARGLDLDKLRAAALKKSQAYTALSAAVAGQRQALVDKLDKAKTVAAVEKITVNYTYEAV